MGRTMRAKVVVTRVENANERSRQIFYRAVGKEDGPYPENGTDENNTFALYTPALDLSMWINNPAIGEIKVGDQFYLDFIKIEK